MQQADGRMTVLRKQKELAYRVAAVEALGKVNCPSCGAPYDRGRFTRPYFICSTCGHRWSENPVTDALGKWLTELHQQYPWDWFATLTFAREGITPAGAQYWFRRYLDGAGEAGIAKPYAFRADEYGPLHGRYHLHALVGNVSHLQIYCGARLQKNEWGNPCCWVHRWPCGYARIFPYDPQRGASYYLSKYVVKALATWELIGLETENLVFRGS
jgi:hypothetical protein